MDGTFKSCPVIFSQIYTIYIKLNEQYFAVAMAFLPEKSEQTYRRLIREIDLAAAMRGLRFNPQEMHVDFEIAVMQTVRHELGINPTGCLSISARVFIARCRIWDSPMHITLTILKELENGFVV